MNKPSDKYLFSHICLVLTLATLAVYWQVHRFDFVNFDDFGYVKENPHIQNGFTFTAVKWAFSFSDYACNWHPLTWLSHSLDCQLFGINAGAHHFVNLLIHIANTLLLFTVLKRMTGAIWRSAFVAALFALHPLHVESVAWISERKDVLSTLFWILTIAAYYRYVKRPGTVKYLLTLFCFALGLMAKPMLVTLPFVLLLLDYWPMERISQKTIYRLLWEKMPFFILSTASSIITFVVQKRVGAVATIDQLPFKIRIANTFISYVQYIGKMFYPKNLSVFYPHSDMKLPMMNALAAVVLLVIISAAVFYLARKYKYLPVGWLWYLGTLVPVIGLVQVGGLAMADRYTYMPLTGLFIIIVWGLNDISAKWRYGKSFIGVFGTIVIIILGYCTFIQAGYWRNGITLFEHSIAATKDNYMMQQCLADTLRRQGKIEQALEHYRISLRINDNFVPSHISIGTLFNDIGKYDEAIEHLTRAIQINPEKPEPRIYEQLAQAMIKTGRINEALAAYEKACRLEPDNDFPFNNLAWHLATYNDDKIRNPAKALVSAKHAYELTNHKNPGVMDTLAVAYAANGDFDKAIEITKQAMELCRYSEQESLKKELESRLVLYENGKPYIDK